MFQICYGRRAVVRSSERPFDFDKSGKVIAAYSGRVQDFTPSGELLESLLKWEDGRVNAWYLVFDNSDNLYTYYNQKILIYDSDFNLIREFGQFGGSSGGVYSDTRIAIDTSNNIYIAEGQNGYLQVYENQGKFLIKITSDSLGIENFNPIGVAVDRSGKIYTVNGDKIVTIDPLEFVERPTLDTQSPVFDLIPNDINVDATSKHGATVTFELSATDNTDPAPEIKCSPGSGSIFAIGDTTVSCIAVDSLGNTSDEISFTVTVNFSEKATYITYLGSIGGMYYPTDLVLAEELGMIVVEVEE